METDEPQQEQNDEIIKLNVGGAHFEAWKSTLLKYPDSMLGRLFTTSSQLAKPNEDGEYFFDRNPDYFNAILNYLRSGKVMLNDSMSYDLLDEELQFWGYDVKETDVDWSSLALRLQHIAKERASKSLDEVIKTSILPYIYDVALKGVFSAAFVVAPAFALEWHRKRQSHGNEHINNAGEYLITDAYSYLNYQSGHKLLKKRLEKEGLIIQERVYDHLDFYDRSTRDIFQAKDVLGFVISWDAPLSRIGSGKYKDVIQTLGEKENWSKRRPPIQIRSRI
jgi:hypothetical protein